MSKNKKYSLIYRHLGIDRVVCVKEFDQKQKKIMEKSKVDLTTIDALTSCFSNEEEFKMYFGLPQDCELFIVYQSEKVLKSLPCIYEDNGLMRHFAIIAGENNENNKKWEDSCFQSLISKLLVMTYFTKFRKFIFADKKINVYIKNKLRDYLDYPNEQTFVISKLAQELHNYKNLRGLVLSIQNYEMAENVEILNFSVPEHDVILPERKIDIRRFVPSEDEEEPLFAPNSEEEENYLRYIDSLPIESFYDDDSDSYTDQIEKKRR